MTSNWLFWLRAICKYCKYKENNSEVPIIVIVSKSCYYFPSWVASVTWDFGDAKTIAAFAATARQSGTNKMLFLLIHCRFIFQQMMVTCCLVILCIFRRIPSFRCTEGPCSTIDTPGRLIIYKLGVLLTNVLIKRLIFIFYMLNKIY